MDSDVERVAADAIRAISKATALFVELLATKALAQAALGKRKNFKYTDIESVAKRDRRIVDMGLPELFQKDAVFEETRTRLEEEKSGVGRKGVGRKGAAGAEAEAREQKKMRPLTDFFFNSGGGGGGGGAVEVVGVEGGGEDDDDDEVEVGEEVEEMEVVEEEDDEEEIEIGDDDDKEEEEEVLDDDGDGDGDGDV